jgi:uncharacterized protein YxeA
MQKIVIIIISTALIIGGCSLVLVIGKNNAIDHDNRSKVRTEMDSIEVDVLNSEKNKKNSNGRPEKPP